MYLKTIHKTLLFALNLFSCCLGTQSSSPILSEHVVQPILSIEQPGSVSNQFVLIEDQEENQEGEQDWDLDSEDEEYNHLNRKEVIEIVKQQRRELTRVKQSNRENQQKKEENHPGHLERMNSDPCQYVKDQALGGVLIFGMVAVGAYAVYNFFKSAPKVGKKDKEEKDN